MCRKASVASSSCGARRDALFRESYELFGTASWVAVLLGQGIVPEEHEPAADGVDAKLFADALDKMKVSYRAMAEHMPTHGDFIADACKRVAAAA